MAKFILCNNQSISNVFAENENRNGFPLSAKSHNVGGNVFYSSVQKLKVPDNNFELFGSDFVAVVGTMFYRGILSCKQLKTIYNDFLSCQDLDLIRNKSIGNYVLIIKQQGKAYICSDKGAIYYCYYYFDQDKNRFMVSTSLYEMVRAAKDKIDFSVNEFNMLERIFQMGIIGNETEIKGINKLEGNEYIKIDLKDEKFSVVPFDSNNPSVDNRSFDIITEEAADRFIGNAKIIKENFQNDEVGICMTGGLDSRMILSSLLANDIKPCLNYGIGNSPLTNTFTGDLEVNKIYSERYGLHLNVMDWRTPKDIDEGWDYYIDKYGMLASVYCASPYIMKSFENNEQKLMLMGVNGEIYRNMTVVEHAKSDYVSIDEIIDKYYVETDMESIIGRGKSLKFRNHLKQEILGVLKDFLSPNGMLHKDKFVMLDIKRRNRMAVAIINLINRSHYSFAFLGEYNLSRYAIIPTKEKEDSRLIIRIIKNIYPDILKVPFFTRFTWRRFDNVNDKIVYSSPWYKRAFAWLKSKLLSKKTKRFLRPLLERLKSRSKDANYISPKEIGRQISPIIKKYALFEHQIDAEKSEYVSKEGRYALLLTTLAKLGIR